MCFVQMELEILFALTSFRTDLTEQGLLSFMNILCVSLQLARTCKHHGAIDTGELQFVSFTALAMKLRALGR